MDNIDKIFGQHPFIYHINGKYYAFGAGVCAECDGNSALLERRYKDFEDSLTIKKRGRYSTSFQQKRVLRERKVKNA